MVINYILADTAIIMSESIPTKDFDELRKILNDFAHRCCPDGLNKVDQRRFDGLDIDIHKLEQIKNASMTIFKNRTDKKKEYPLDLKAMRQQWEYVASHDLLRNLIKLIYQFDNESENYILTYIIAKLCDHIIKKIAEYNEYLEN